MKNELKISETLSETARVEAFSDAVFAIAITLLILEIKVPNVEQLKTGLLDALVEKWPSYLAFCIGFFTILVCWINHHYMFDRIKTTSHSLILINSLTLFVVTFVPFPAAVLSSAFKGGDLQTAVQFFGLSFILIGICYTGLARFVYNNKELTYTNEELKYKKAIRIMYLMSIIHTVIAFFVAFVSVFASIILYTALFLMYLFPKWYINLVMKFQGKKTDRYKIKH
jgi:uncharacterized membrane protein